MRLHNRDTNGRLEQVVLDSTIGVLRTRASVLRRRADDLTVRVKDAWGVLVRIVSPEAVVMMRTAEFFERCAADAGDRARGDAA